ncbi:MAG: hypothetical protein NW223_20565 [Hyphomicrobiaceae bacterium]|nr:hypothetical protein [Hyphomicrobiaceae bacterium]
MTATKDFDQAAPQARTTASLGWAVRRAALGLVLMLSVVMLSAWLLYSSIDPEEAIAAGVAPATQTEARE